MASRDRTPSTAASRRRRSGDPVPSALDRYLLDSERLVFAVRRHSSVLAGTTSAYLCLVFVAVLLLAFADGSGAIAGTGLAVFLAASAWFGWKVGDWWVERFTVTDRRVLLVSGLLTRRVAIMPLRKVTDLTFERSFAGRLFGYGAFVMESAGQHQALSRIDFLPRPETLYLQMSDLLFGTGAADFDPDEDGGERRPRPRRTRPRLAERPLPPPPAHDAGPTTPAYRRPPVSSPGSGPTTPATTPLPSIARSGPVARRPRGRYDGPGRYDDPGGDGRDGPRHDATGRPDRMP